MYAYQGWIHAILGHLNELLPSLAIRIFVTLALHGLPQKYNAAHDQILGSQVNPTMNFTSSALLRIPQKDKHEKTYFVCRGKYCFCIIR